MSKSISSKAGKVTAEDREKVEANKRRDELKNLLLNKFQTKYADKHIPNSILLEYINSFLDSSSLTAANLQKLDEKILAYGSHGDKKPAGGKAENKNESAEDNDDKLSVMSGATEFVEAGKPKTKTMLDTKTRLIKGEEGEPLKARNEDDEWVAIMKFNNQLYQEELKQEALKKAQQKQLMKAELDKQMKEKNNIKKRTKEEEQAYLEYQNKHLKELEEIEKKKQEEKRNQIKSEKASRDKQRKDDALRKKIEENEVKKQDKKLIERMKLEMELEKKSEAERKELEKQTVKKMMEESLKLKEEQKIYSVKEKEEDIKRAEMQKKISEEQEQEWKDNYKRKDERNKKLLENALQAAGGKGLKSEVIATDKKMLEQMEVLAKKKELEEARKEKLKKQKQLEVKATLDKQIAEKKVKKQVDKTESAQQAEMWKKDLEVHHEQEAKNSEKQKELNKKHQEYLIKQMELAKKGKGNAMTDKEYLMNKQLLEELKAKAAAEENPKPTEVKP